jgi:exonuclease VII large subunit
MPPQQGPTEKRLVEQDAKIASIQAGLDQLVQTQKHHAKQVESQFKQAAQREQDNMNKMDQALKHIEVSVDNAMTKSMHQYQASMDEKFQEIKHLFLSTKRPAPPGEEDMQD